MVATSKVKSVGVLTKNQYGAPVHVILRNRQGQAETKEEARLREIKATMKQRCARHLEMLMGSDVQDKLAYRKEMLLCQYKEVHSKMKLDQEEYERSLREGNVSVVKNPYVRDYGDAIVNPYNFSFVHQPRPCEKRHTLLVSVHSATKVSAHVLVFLISLS